MFSIWHITCMQGERKKDYIMVVASKKLRILISYELLTQNKNTLFPHCPTFDIMVFLYLINVSRISNTLSYLIKKTIISRSSIIGYVRFNGTGYQLPEFFIQNKTKANTWARLSWYEYSSVLHKVIYPSWCEKILLFILSSDISMT